MRAKSTGTGRRSGNITAATRLTMDISDDAVYGIRNTLVVKVDSRESVNIPPFGFVVVI